MRHLRKMHFGKSLLEKKLEPLQPISISSYEEKEQNRKIIRPLTFTNELSWVSGRMHDC